MVGGKREQGPQTGVCSLCSRSLNPDFDWDIYLLCLSDEWGVCVCGDTVGGMDTAQVLRDEI